MFGPELVGQRVRLRSPALGDVATFSRWFADPEVVRYWWRRDAPWARMPRLAAFGLFLYACLSRRAILWTIEHEGKAIGHCHLRRIDRTNGNATTAVLIGDRSQQG